MLVSTILKSESNSLKLKKIKALQEESELLSRLNHKNIVQFLGSYNDGKFFNMFLELISGGTLEDLYKKYNGLSEPVVAVYTKHILQGLEYLHYKGVIHRDIKAANIMIEEDGQCKLTDFGSSKILCAD